MSPPASAIRIWGLALALWLSSSPLGALGWQASQLPGSAVALALAGGGLAVPADIGLSAVNPAHLFGRERETLEYGYLRMFADLGGHTIRWHGLLRGAPTQLSLRSLADDDLELRSEIPTAEPLAYFGARLLTISVLRGYKLGATRLGVQLTGAYQRIFTYSASALWLSAGWRGSFSPALSWGLTVRNLGFGEALQTARESPVGRLGAGLALNTNLFNSTLGVDLWYDGRYGAWPVVTWQGGTRAFRLYTGLRIIPEGRLLSAGFRFSHRRWTLAYAVGYQEAALGLPQMLTVERQLK